MECAVSDCILTKLGITDILTYFSPKPQALRQFSLYLYMMICIRDIHVSVHSVVNSQS